MPWYVLEYKLVHTSMSRRSKKRRLRSRRNSFATAAYLDDHRTRYKPVVSVGIQKTQFRYFIY